MSGLNLTGEEFPSDISTRLENCPVQFFLLAIGLQSSSSRPQCLILEKGGFCSTTQQCLHLDTNT